MVGSFLYFFQYGRIPQIIKNAGKNKNISPISAPFQPSINAPTKIAKLKRGPGKAETIANPNVNSNKTLPK
jgi:hypothetical protein